MTVGHAEPVVHFSIPRQCIELLSTDRADEQTLRAFVLVAPNHAVAAVLTLAELGKEVFNFPESTELRDGDFSRTLARNLRAVANDPHGERARLLQKLGGLPHYLSEGLRAADEHCFGFANANDYWGQQSGATNERSRSSAHSHSTWQPAEATWSPPEEEAPKRDEGRWEPVEEPDAQSHFTHQTRVEPTEEQAVIFDAVQGASADGVVKAEAFAGTGKTTLCGFVGEGFASEGVPRERMLYLAFNANMAKHARSRLGQLMVCRTTDSLAYSVTDPWSRWGEARTARDAPMHWGDMADRLGLPPWFGRFRRSVLVKQVHRTVQSFCYSADVEMSLRHVPDLDWPAGGEEAVLRWAGDLWARMLSPAENIPVKPELVMKLWDLQGGQIDADVVLFDEAQDANAAFMSVLRRSDCLRLLIGDQHQQLYDWRGAVDAMKIIDGSAFPLTRSWRFGPHIAEYANKILASKAVPPTEKIVGNSGVQSVVRFYDEKNMPRWPITILARTNAMVFYTAVDIAEAGHRLHIVGDLKDINWLLTDALKLFRGQGVQVTHPMLIRFKDWEALAVEYDMTGDPELKRVIKIIEERHSVLERQLETLARYHVSERNNPAAILATTHKVKGQEWDRVMLAGDFICPDQFEEFDEFRRNAELNILYVAATRAIKELFIPQHLGYGLD